MLKQSRRNVWRSACSAHNAYSPVLALRAAFGTSTSFHQDDDHIPSMWEPPIARPLETAKSDHHCIAGRDEAITERLTESTKAKHSPAQTSEKQSERLHEPTDENGQDRDRMPPSKQVLNQSRGADFLGHKQWQEHMSRIRKESSRVKRLRWKKNQNPTNVQLKDFLNYDEKIVHPEPGKMTPPVPIPWAMDESARRASTVNACLASEIERFAAWARPTQDEQCARAAVVRETEELIRSALKTGTTGIELFGSEKSGIALPHSDIDLRIYDTKFPDMPHLRLAGRLKRICTFMHASDKYVLAVVRESGYPILNCQHRESGLDIQIVAVGDATPQQEIVTRYTKEIPHLREVYFLVRTMLGMRGLIDVWNGGMGSYSTFVMVLAVLDRHMKHYKATRGESSNVSSASQLIAFLEFYRKLDPSKYGVAVHPRQLFKKHESTREGLNAYRALAEKRGDRVRAGQWGMCVTRPLQSYLLCLQDPANPFNDLGKKGHAIKHILATLLHLNKSLAKRCSTLKIWQQSRTNVTPTPEPLLLPLVGRCHEVYFHRRKKLRRYGERLGLVKDGSGEKKLMHKQPGPKI